MSHVPEATGGSTYYGDLVVEALDLVGAPISDGTRVLDFGCSSGRVVRVLHAWQPEAEYYACDPNEPAIAWASEHLSGIKFFVSPLAPPVDLEESSLDAAFAISVWSHFDAAPARRWLGEMHRLLRPGGHLVMTAQGLNSLRHFGARDELGDAIPAAARELDVSGFAFFRAFGPDGDWGVPATGWGMAFMTAEWLTEQLTPKWHVALFKGGRVENNQDLYVLRRT